MTGKTGAALTGLLTGVLLLVFVAGCVLMAVRDHRATTRCHSIGGLTYDSGQHCVIGGKTVSTR